MGIPGQLRGVKSELIKDLEQTPVTLSQVAKKYGVSRQSIYDFIERMGVKRPERRHPKECPICQAVIRISKEPQIEFLCIDTIRKELGVEKATFLYHMRVLRKKRLVSRTFGRIRSKKVERAYQIYFTKSLPISTIGRLVGLKSLWSILKRYKDLGWDVPAPLFTYNSKDRRKSAAKRVKRKRGR